MEKVYKSRVARWYRWSVLLMVCTCAVTLFLCFRLTWILLIDLVLIAGATLLMVDILLHTDYTIKGDKLHIRSGVFYHITLPIHKITAVTHKSTILSSPALSAKRIGLIYGKGSRVYISPVNQEEFIAMLKSINPGISESDKV